MIPPPCRFISAMEKLAELSSDKEQLEHLVERLQEETDTIGDYVIMYQHQRKQQRIKIQEKEQEVSNWPHSPLRLISNYL